MAKLVYKEGLIVYLAGPIRSVPDYKATFASVAAYARRMFAGCVVYNPAKLPAGHDNRWYMQRCTKMLLRCDVVVLVQQRGWEVSRGTQAEVTLARYCDIPVMFNDIESFAEITEKRILFEMNNNLGDFSDALARREQEARGLEARCDEL